MHGNIDQLSALVATGETSLNEEKQAHLISLVDEYKQKDDGIIRGIYHKDNHIKVKRAYETLKILAKTIESTNKYPSPYGTVDSSGLARRITADPLPEATVENQNQVTISNELDGCCIGLDEDHQHQVNLDYCIYSDEERAMNALASSGTIEAYNDIAQKTMAAPISVLKNLNVDIELRNNGYGSELMEKYLEDVDRHKSDSILVADLCQSNQF
ncbi:hypothetical protein I3271_07525 [Photobacterium leiognathi]|uniref:hypothetical protein n=1 Tax=Photobacterium leiognathi TaxID=553611 RepID=UPI001EDD7595|nr:hypothetical protein [Photobacterium leiognathi]MCG3884536.1 hypothetical protein [Photobacterium leiognathi]